MHLQCFLYDPDIPYENIRADYHHVCCSVSVSSGTPLSACLTTSLMTIVLCFCVVGLLSCTSHSEVIVLQQS
jgi:hypothetical protein